MRTRSLLLAAGLLVVVCGADAQPVPTAPPTVSPSGPPPRLVPSVPRQPPVPPLVVPDSPPLVPAAPPLVPTVPAEPSVEQLLKELEAVQAEKAALLKREADLKAAVQKKLESIQKQADKLGAGTSAKKAGVPIRVGNVRVVGFSEKDEPKVVGLLDVYPGQILQFPKLEESRVRMEKAGYKGVEVLAIPSAPESDFSDIHVRAAPSGR